MIPRYIKSILVFLLLAAVYQSARAATIFDMYDANVHNRFDSNAFVGAPFNWSGVGKSGSTWATMIAPDYFLSANHFHPGIGGTVTFWETNARAGTTVTRAVAGGQRIGTTDLWLGKLDSAVTGSIAIYGIGPAATLDGNGMGAYANKLSYTVGTGGVLNFVVGQNRFDVVEISPSILGTFDAIGYVQDLAGDTNFIPANETFLQGGDSGAPSFILDGGVLKLAGIHSFIATGALPSDFGPGQELDYKTPEAWNNPLSSRNISFDTFVPNYQSQIQLAQVPEPSSAMLLAAVCGLAGAWKLRRKRIL